MPESDYITCILPSDTKQTIYHGPDRPGNWHGNYKGPDFNYNFNNLGFRGPELNSNDLALVSFGPSFAMGLGVPQENRYADLIAKKFNLTNFSFASTGGDNLSILRNITSFFSKNCENLNVKLIIVLWADCARFSCIKQTDKDYIRLTYGPGWKDLSKEQTEYMLYWSQNTSELHLLEYTRIVDLLAKKHNFPIIQISTNFVKLSPHFNTPSFYCKPIWYDDKSFIKDFIAWKDFARDNHPGIKTHQSVANIIYGIMENNTIQINS